MFGFNYYTPTKVVFGKGTELQVAELIREFGGRKVLIHYGGGSVVRSGLLKKVTDRLEEAGRSLIVEALDRIEAGDIRHVKQDEDRATYARILNKKGDINVRVKRNDLLK